MIRAGYQIVRIYY